MDPSLVLACVAAFAVWLTPLVSHRRRTGLPDTDRIVWTIVLCTLNILGMILYWTIAPRGDHKVFSEEEHKAILNEK